MNRRALTKQAMQAAVAVRDRLDLDPFGPVDPYEIAQLLGVKVVFLKTSMEGFYYKGPSPRILLSSSRPLARRTFTCAHELGHHEFGHGSTIDELQEDDRTDQEKPEEVLANAFAAFLLMPSVGIRGSVARRGWGMNTLTPEQLYTVACQFGVGYITLLNHLSFALRDIDEEQRTQLKRWTPQRLRKQLLPEDYDSLLLVDNENETVAFDIEKGGAILAPQGLQLSGEALTHRGSASGRDLYWATKRGTATLSGLNEPFEIRVMPKEYEGSAANRYLEDPDE